VVDTFVRAIETTKKDGSRFNLLQILTAGNCDDGNSEDNFDGEDYEGSGDYEGTDDCDSWQAAGAGPVIPTWPRPAHSPGSYFNQCEKSCCRFAAGAAN
jgi:hypothetical protein